MKCDSQAIASYEEDELLIELSCFGLKSEATRGVQKENGPSDSLLVDFPRQS